MSTNAGPPPLGEIGARKHPMLRYRMRHDGHRVPKGPRFGLLRRIVQWAVDRIRGGGD